jgi:LysR family hydrogen peroxide-inducible transcriptional activator
MEMPTLRQLEYALAVAEHGHFGRAAAALHISQPGLSAQVRELERRLGVVLFERSRATTRPTPAGVEVLARARRLLADAADLVRVAQSHEGAVRGRVRLAAIPTLAPYLLPAIVVELRRRWPDVELELAELRTAELVAAVVDAEVDLGLLATPVDTGGLEVADLGFEPFLLAVAAGHELAGVDDVPATVLGEVDLLLLEDGHCLRDHALAACRLAGAAGSHRDVRNASLAVLGQMVAGSDAATLLPASAAGVEARPGSGVVTRSFAERDMGRMVSMVWRPSDPRSSLFAEAADALVDVVAAATPRR